MVYLSCDLPADYDDNLVALPAVMHNWEACPSQSFVMDPLLPKLALWLA